MLRTINLLFVIFVFNAVWAGPGATFQLFGDNSSARSTGDIGSSYRSNSGSNEEANPKFDLGDTGAIKSPDEQGTNIWIPGLGVVAKMPKLDFGLEMLYGAPQPHIDAPRTAQELDEFESDFAIKGTLKRKF